MKLIEWEHTSVDSAEREMLSLEDLRGLIEHIISRTREVESLNMSYTSVKKELDRLTLCKPFEQPTPAVLPPKPDGAGFKVLSIVTLVWGFSFATFIPITMTKNSLSPIPAPLLTAIVIIGLAIALIPQLFIIPGKRKSLKQQIQRWEEECATMQQDYQQKMKAWETNVKWCEKENQLLPQKRKELRAEVDKAQKIYEDKRNSLSELCQRYGMMYFNADDKKYYLYTLQTLVSAFSFIEKGYADTWEDALKYYHDKYTSEEMEQMSITERFSFLQAQKEYIARLNTERSMTQDDTYYLYEQQRIAAEQKKEMELELARAHDDQAKQQEELERIRKNLDNIDLLQTLAYIERTKNNS